MSGIDEQKFRNISIPDGEFAGTTPAYWCLKDMQNRAICWLALDEEKTLMLDNRRMYWDSRFIVNRLYISSTSAWSNNMFLLVKSVESVYPFGYISKDEQFIEKIIDELLRIYVKTGYVLN